MAASELLSAPTQRVPPTFPTIRGQWVLRLTVWLGFLGLLLLSWGIYNAWPAALTCSLLFFPFSLFLAVKLLRKSGPGPVAPSFATEWELLVSFLLLATGAASGAVFLMAVGWVAIGWVLLRPMRRNQFWGEWLKIFFLFVWVLPIELDFVGNRVEVFSPFLPHSSQAGWNAEDHSLLALICGWRVALFFFGAWLKPAQFCAAIFLFPALVALVGFVFEAGSLHHFELWQGELIVCAVALLVCWVIVRFELPFLRDNGTAQRWAHASRKRTASTWLIALVVLVQHSLFSEGYLSSEQWLPAAAGAMLWIFLLAWLRWRTPPSNLDWSSQLLIVGAGFFVLAAEWTNLAFFSQCALGLLLAGVFSWRRTWRWLAVYGPLAAWLMLLPGLFRFAEQHGLGWLARWEFRAVAFLAIAAATVWAHGRGHRRPTRVAEDLVWQPIKRFAFILLCLVLGFQGLSAVWPGTRIAEFPASTARTGAPLRIARPQISFPGMVRLTSRAFPLKHGSVRIFIAKPAEVPVEIVSANWAFQARGYAVLVRKGLPHPRGRMIYLRGRNGQVERSALCWFDHEAQAFAGYRKARHILWSGWNLAHRQLRFVWVEAEPAMRADEMNDFADQHGWFEELIWPTHAMASTREKPPLPIHEQLGRILSLRHGH